MTAKTERGRFKEVAYGFIVRIPEGRVATYGSIAALAGSPGAAQTVGNIVMEFQHQGDFPWWRVIKKRGRNGFVSESAPRDQLQRLSAEGVRASGGVIDLAAYEWRGAEDGR